MLFYLIMNMSENSYKLTMIFKNLCRQSNPFILKVGSALCNSDYHNSLKQNMREFISYRVMNKLSNYNLYKFSISNDEDMLEIIRDSEELLNGILHYFIDMKRKTLTGTEECLINGVEMFLNMENGFPIAKGTFPQKHYPNMEELKKTLDDVIIDEVITWVHVCALFANCVNFVQLYHKELKDVDIKCIPIYFKSYLLRNEKVLNFVLKNGGWEGICNSCFMKPRVFSKKRWLIYLLGAVHTIGSELVL